MYSKLRNVYFSNMELILCHIFTVNTSDKNERPSLPFRVAFQQGSVHCITKLLRGFQTMSKACWGLPETAASERHTREGLGLHQVEVCTGAASWCINAPRAGFILCSPINTGEQSLKHLNCQSKATSLCKSHVCWVLVGRKILHFPRKSCYQKNSVGDKMISKSNHGTSFMTL